MKAFQLLLTAFFALAMTILNGQVPTVVLNGKDIRDFIHFHNDKAPVPIALPEVDVQAALAEDAAAGIEMPRFGVKIPVSVGKSDGEIEERGEFLIWKTSFAASDAKSLNIEFSKLFLPEDAAMYLYNGDETMFVGPITQKHVYDGQYATDILKGNVITIEVFLKGKDFEAFSLEVTNVIHGFHAGSQERDYGDSETCNVDVNCPVGTIWENQRDATCLILIGNTNACSGVLVNNACQDLRAFLLTANHCVNGASGYLNWTFRFNYDSPDPVPGTCRGSEPTTWITFSGANLRACWSPGDFALLELANSIIGQPTITLAGWDRTATVPTTATGIHHPNKDVKKISITSGATGSVALSANGGVAGSGTNHIRTVWGTGITAGGSSGSPLFDPARRVIGQLHSGTSFCATPAGPDWYGRLFSSWTGGGGNGNRLSNWLGGTTLPTTTNTIRSPWINNNNNVIVCTSANRQFTLNNSVPGKAVTWSVSNPTLFATTGGAARTGTGTTATLRAAGTVSHGAATLTFTLTQAGCTPVLITTQIWVGVPPMPTTNPPGNPTIELGQGSSIFVVLDYAPFTSSSNAIWSSSGSIQQNGPNPSTTPSYQMDFQAVGTGLGSFYAQTSNACGVSPVYTGNVNITSGPGGNNKQVQNNPSPTRISFVCQLPEEYTEHDHVNTIHIFTSKGILIAEENFVGQRKSIQTQNWQPDIYYTKVNTAKGVIWGKVMIIK